MSEKREKREILLGSIPDAYITRLSGKPYISHKGLLALSHEHGIERIDTELLSWESGEAIFKATVSGSRGTYTGHGDANPTNVKSTVKGACIRMAETRGVNRALRFYLGIGITSLEEMPDIGPVSEGKSENDWAEFCTAVSGLGLKMETLTAYCEAKGRPAPNVMQATQRKMLFAHLKSDTGRKALSDFVGVSEK